MTCLIIILQEESGSLTSGSGLDLMGERDGEFEGLEDEGEEGAHELASDDSANDFWLKICLQ